MKEKLERFKNEKIVINVRSQKQYNNFMKICEEQELKWSGGDLPTQGNVYNEYEEETCINLNNLKALSYSTTDYFKNKCYEIITYEDFMKEGNMKYKVGDKVKVISELTKDRIDYGAYFDEEMDKHLGKKMTIERVYDDTYALEEDDGGWFWSEDMIEKLAQFTKTDLKDNHIVVSGTRKEVWEDVSFKEQYMENLKHEIFGNLTINEVYEFDKLVWKREEQILDEVEIIEEDKQIETINDFTANVGAVDESNVEEYIHILFEQETILYFKINEIIDKLNESRR